MRWFIAFLFAVCCFALQAESVKYLFLFIGDGMSAPQRLMAEEFRRATGKEGLAMNAMPVQAYTTTHCADSFITDSAAAGTALACGEKAKFGALGLNAKGQKLDSIATVAKQTGRRVGLISTVTLNHATPAAFYAHNPKRGNYYAIGLEMLESGFDFFGGGTQADKEGKKAGRDAQGDLLDLARRKQFNIVNTSAGLRALNADSPRPVYAIAEVLRDDGTMPYAIDADPKQPTLADFTAKAVNVLDNPNGFFLMVESGKIDYACHANDPGAALRETEAFDNAIQVALDFARKHPEETAIVVTGDHETGGVTLGFAGTGYRSYIERLATQKISGEEFARQFSTMRKDNPKLTFDDVKPLLTESFGFDFSGDTRKPLGLYPFEISRLEAGFQLAMGRRELLSTEHPSLVHGSNGPFATAAQTVLANRAALAFGTFHHTALPVVTSATGKRAEEFSAVRDNTDVAKLCKKLLK